MYLCILPATSTPTTTFKIKLNKRYSSISSWPSNSYAIYYEHDSNLYNAINKLPIAKTKEINALNHNFLYGSTPKKNTKIVLVKWDSVRKQKREDGPGIKRTILMNKTFLAKLV